MENKVPRFVRAVLIGAVCGAVLCTVLLLLCSLVFVKLGNMPEGATAPCAIVLSCAAALTAGFVAAKITHSKGLLVGLAASAVLFIVILAVGLGSMSDTPSLFSVLLRLGLMLAGGAVGGIFGVNRRQRRK